MVCYDMLDKCNAFIGYFEFQVLFKHYKLYVMVN